MSITGAKVAFEALKGSGGAGCGGAARRWWRGVWRVCKAMVVRCVEVLKGNGGAVCGGAER